MPLTIDQFMWPRAVTFHAQFNPASGKIALYAIAGDPGDGQRSAMLPAVFQNLEPGSSCQPTLELSESDAQSLIDELWKAGVRPRDIGSAGHLAAVERHREEMSAIAIGLLRQNGVEL
jgi:hypothetical protein